jgi:hypothetical protein
MIETNHNQPANHIMSGHTYAIIHRFMGAIEVFISGYAEVISNHRNQEYRAHCQLKAKLREPIKYNGELLSKGDEVFINRGNIQSFRLIH